MNSIAESLILPLETGDRRALILVNLGSLRAGLAWSGAEFRSKKYAKINGKLMVAKCGFRGSVEVIGVGLGGLGGLGMRLGGSAARREWRGMVRKRARIVDFSPSRRGIGAL